MYLLTEDWYDRVPLWKHTVPNESTLITGVLNTDPAPVFSTFYIAIALEKRSNNPIVLLINVLCRKKTKMNHLLQSI